MVWKFFLAPCSTAGPSVWVVLLFALLSPLTVFSQPQSGTDDSPPDLWPQACLIEGKGNDLPSPVTGMPVPDPLQELFDVLHYNMSLQVDPEQGWVAGNVVIIFRAVGQQVDSFVLDFVDQMNCASMSITHPYPAHLTFVHQDDRITAQLEHPVKQGDIGRIVVQFWGQPEPEGLFGYRVDVTDAGRPVVATVSEPWSARSWWPCKDDPRDKASVATNISVPPGLTAVSNGTFLGVERQTFSWLETLPMMTGCCTSDRKN